MKLDGWKHEQKVHNCLRSMPSDCETFLSAKEPAETKWVVRSRWLGQKLEIGVWTTRNANKGSRHVLNGFLEDTRCLWVWKQQPYQSGWLKVTYSRYKCQHNSGRSGTCAQGLEVFKTIEYKMLLSAPSCHMMYQTTQTQQGGWLLVVLLYLCFTVRKRKRKKKTRCTVYAGFLDCPFE